MLLVVAECVAYFFSSLPGAEGDQRELRAVWALPAQLGGQHGGERKQVRV